MKIGTRVSLSICFLILLMVVGMSAVFFYAQEASLVKEIHERQLILVKTLRQVSEESLAMKDDILLLKYLKLVKRTDGVVYGLVVDGQGKVLAHTDTDRWGEVIPPSESALSAEAMKEGRLFERALKDAATGKDVIEMTLPLGAPSEGVLARVGFDKATIDAQVQAVLAAHRQKALMITAAALFLGLLLSMGLARTLVRPIRRLADASALIGKGKLDTVIPVTSKDELGSLAADFNKMAEQLKELDQMKKDFVSSVTHELRSPLHSTRLYLGLFFKGGAGELTEKQKEYLKIIESNTLRLAKFIDDLLDLAKLERGKLDVQKQEFELKDIFKEMRAMFMPHSEQKKINFEVPPGEVLPKLLGDPERTRQVMINLLSNAFKFTPEGGTIAVLAERQNGSMEISVKDSGMGIPNDQIDLIFNKFEQVKGVRTKMMGHQKGTGLGLAIVKSLVEAQGGKIRVESALNTGSTFTFSIPLLKS